MGKINLKAGAGKSKAQTNAQEKETEVLSVLEFGPFLIDGESAADYEAFRQSCLKAVGPKDALEKVWLQDFMDYFWEAQRLRRMKAAILQTARKEAVYELVLQFGGGSIDWQKAKQISEKWSISEPGIRKYVEELLELHGLTLDAIVTKAMLNNIEPMETIDRLIASYDYRRDAAIRELEKRRDQLAKRAIAYTDSWVDEVGIEI